ncbi:unnamed protein product [Prorocentrum cordatum]|uniref:Altered inheritance of mitochondria protein 24, mitochondrial n=1 Tax=Prorocentrum cordatum TaxID=2364126 RepID=A0ABN9RWH1_9DINO|nr:unnamed protein product [Polarella glacialis]
MAVPNPELVPPVPVHKLMVRDNRFIDIELKQDGAEAFHALNLRQGDIIKLSAPVLEPEPTALVLDRPTRGGLVVTVRPEGLYGEEGKIITRQSLAGSKFTVLGGRGAAKSGEFTVHRGFALDETGLLKLHFAHGSQINKLMLTKGTDIKIKDRAACSCMDLAGAHGESGKMPELQIGWWPSRVQRSRSLSCRHPVGAGAADQEWQRRRCAVCGEAVGAHAAAHGAIGRPAGAAVMGLAQGREVGRRQGAFYQHQLNRPASSAYGGGAVTCMPPRFVHGSSCDLHVATPTVPCSVYHEHVVLAPCVP